MRRLNGANYPIVYEPSALSYWSCDFSPSSTSTVTDSSVLGNNHLITYPVTGALRSGSLFPNNTLGYNSLGSVRTNAEKWLEGPALSTNQFALSTASAWSLAFWFASGTGTTCLAEFSYTCGFVQTPEANRQWGFYRNASDGALSWGWDTSATPNYIYNTGVTIPTTGVHLGFVCDINPNSTAFRRCSTYVNGVLAAYSDTQPAPPTGYTGASCRFIIGASRSYATTVTSPAFVSTSGLYRIFDDIAYWNRAAHDKVREAYRNATRGWDERRLLESGQQRALARVLVEDGDGNPINLCDYYGTDFVQDIRISDDVNDAHKAAQLKLRRYRGERLNLAPLDEAAVNNINQRGNGSYEPLIEYRRKLKIEVACVPKEFTPTEAFYEPIFEGYIDEVGWETETVDVRTIDQIAPLRDQFQIDPKFYAYGEVSTTAAETHLQTYINDNVPRIFLSGSTRTFGYKGGTPLVFTPASSGWVLRYDDAPSGEVAEHLQAVADQIGWRCRYRWDQYRQEDRLTFERPNRDKNYGVALVDRRTTGKFTGTYVKTYVPHDFSIEQPLTLTGTVTNNFTNSRVSRVISDKEVMVEAYPGALGGSESAVGSLSFGNAYDIDGKLLRAVQDIRKDTGAIRNAISVKYKRDLTPIEFTPIEISHSGAGNPLLVDFDETETGTLDSIRSKLVSGETTFTISDSDVAAYNRTWTFDFFSSGRIYSLETLTTAATATVVGTFASSYINAKEVIGVSTPSIQKYGYRPVGIYEGSSGNIDTDAEALALANAVISDLSEPSEALRVTIPFSPWFDLDSSIGLLADARRRWSEDIDVTVTGYEHTIANGVGRTELRLRKANPTAGTAWVSRISVGRDRPSIPGEIKRLPDYSILDNIQTNGGLIVGGRMRPRYLQQGTRRQPRRLFTEMHVGSTPTFLLDNGTLAGVSLGGQAFTHYDPQGNLLSPKTPYYVRFREIDVFGNPEPVDYTTSATRAVVRYNDKPVSVLASGQATGAYFRKGGWYSFPFNTASDPFSCFDEGNLAGGGAYSMTSAIPDAYMSGFTFPSDGTAYVEARMGVWNDGSNKANVATAFGLFSRGARSACNASRPLVAKFGGPTLASPLWHVACPLFVGAASSTVFVNLSSVIHGSSGDYIQLGVWADWDVTPLGTSSANSGIRVCHWGPSGRWSSVSASYMKISFIQD